MPALAPAPLPLPLAAPHSLLQPAADAQNCRCGRRRPLGVVLGLRSGARPRLEGQWFCRPACVLQTMLERSRRDFPDGADTPSRLRHRVPLGLILQARGVITGAELQQALQLQASTGQRLGDVLVEQFNIPEIGIVRAVAAQWGLPVLHLPVAISSKLASLAPAKLFRHAGCLPVQISSTSVVLACAEGPDPALAFALERMHGLRVEAGVVAADALNQVSRQMHESPVPVQTLTCGSRDSLAAEAAALLSRLQPVDSRIVRVGDAWWLRMWLEESARQQLIEAHSEDVLDCVLTLRSGSKGEPAHRHVRA